MSALIAFDTATISAMSFGIAKFALAQVEAKLVGENVGQFERSPNPATVQDIKKWPPVYTMKQLQELLGTVIYIRPRCGIEYATVVKTLRALLKPGAVLLLTEEQLKAIGGLKKLPIEHHRLCIPDEAAAIEASMRGYRVLLQPVGLTKWGLIRLDTRLEGFLGSATRGKASCFRCCIVRRVWLTTRSIGILASRSYGGCYIAKE